MAVKSVIRVWCDPEVALDSSAMLLNIPYQLLASHVSRMLSILDSCIITRDILLTFGTGMRPKKKTYTIAVTKGVHAA